MDRAQTHQNLVALHPFWIRTRVINALILRDIRTRFFGSGIGYLVAIAWPLAHIALLLTIYTVTGRAVPMGNSIMLFFAVGLAPTICFMYMSRFIMLSFIANKPLLNFPIVTIFDVLAARSLLEAACATLVALFLAFVLTVGEIDISPADPIQACAGFMAALFLGLGVGALNGVIVLRFPGWAFPYILVNISMWATSGVLFLPDAFPPQIQYALSWNPLLHAVEWIRQAYYAGYKSAVLDRSYILWVAGTTLFASLTATRYMRRFLLQ